MKVGDLVELSAYGKKLDLNSHAVNKTGLVTRCYDKKEYPPFASQRNAQYSPSEYCLDVLWHGSIEISPCAHVRRDLKHMDPSVRCSRAKEPFPVDMTRTPLPSPDEQRAALIEKYEQCRRLRIKGCK